MGFFLLNPTSIFAFLTYRNRFRSEYGRVVRLLFICNLLYKYNRMVVVGVYFLSDVEHKYLLHQLLPSAREVGVNKELRGLSWFQPPLKPYYDNVKLPMYTVTSKYCPTGRDVYLRNVEKIYPKPTANVALGKMFHGVVSDCLASFLQQRHTTFEEWWKKIRWDEIPKKPENVREPSSRVWVWG